MHVDDFTSKITNYQGNVFSHWGYPREDFMSLDVEASGVELHTTLKWAGK